MSTTYANTHVFLDNADEITVKVNRSDNASGAYYAAGIIVRGESGNRTELTIQGRGDETLQLAARLRELANDIDAQTARLRAEAAEQQTIEVP